MAAPVQIVSAARTLGVQVNFDEPNSQRESTLQPRKSAVARRRRLGYDLP